MPAIPNKSHCCCQHQGGEKPKITGSGKIAGTVRIANEKIHRAGEQVAKRNCRHIKRHYQGFHRFWRLSIRKFKAGDRNHHLGRSQQQVSQQLPGNVGRKPCIYTQLYESDQHKRQDRDKQTDRDFVQITQVNMLAQCRIDIPVKQGDEQDDQQWIGGLNLRGQYLDAEYQSVHMLRLQDPG